MRKPQSKGVENVLFEAFRLKILLLAAHDGIVYLLLIGRAASVV